MVKYSGALLIVLGTILLVASYISETLVDMNWYQFLAMAIIVIGVGLHIYLVRKS